MQMHQVSAARWAAIISLQNMRDRQPRNSFEFDVADYAIDLVLNPGRPDGPFLLQNALKDARSILIRQKRRSRARGMFALLSNSEETGAAEVSPLVETDRTVEQSRPQSAEVQLGWQQEYRALHTAAVTVSSGPVGRVLTGWLVGETLVETGNRLGVSSHYVKKLRGVIRHRALRMAEHRRAA